MSNVQGLVLFNQSSVKRFYLIIEKTTQP